MKASQEILEIVDARVEALYGSVIALRNRFVLAGIAAKAKREQKDRGTLLVIVRRPGDTAFNIGWQRKSWARSNGKWVLHSIYIKRGKSDHYPMRTLLAGAKDWERELVPQLEACFASIREEMRYLTEIRRVAAKRIRHRRKGDGAGADCSATEPGLRLENSVDNGNIHQGPRDRDGRN